MSASRDDVNRWIKEAKDNKAEFIISVCDTYDHDDYPVYCKDVEELDNKLTSYSQKSMQKINEVVHITPDGSVKENISVHTAQELINKSKARYKFSLVICGIFKSKGGDGESKKYQEAELSFDYISQSTNQKEALKEAICSSIDQIGDDYDTIININKIYIPKSKIL